jgi:hypothetical protein
MGGDVVPGVRSPLSISEPERAVSKVYDLVGGYRRETVTSKASLPEFALVALGGAQSFGCKIGVISKTSTFQHHSTILQS